MPLTLLPPLRLLNGAGHSDSCLQIQSPEKHRRKKQVTKNENENVSLWLTSGLFILLYIPEESAQYLVLLITKDNVYVVSLTKRREMFFF